MATPHAPTELLRNELEKLFELDAMQSLARDLLGIDPAELGGATKAPFARALVERAERDEQLEALADAIVLRDRSAEPRLRGVYEGRPADDLAVGTTVAGFKLTKKSNDEGFGSVYLATSPEGKTVTFKLLRDAKVRDRRGLQRFLTAQRALKAVDHPAVQKIVSVGVLPDGRPYLAAEHIDGQLLSSRIGRAGAVHINEARPVFEAIAEGLDRVHAIGLAHADLRAEHVVLVRRNNQLSGVLIDFGVDRLAASRPGELDSASLFVLVGSAKALAPERVRAQAADARSDVYSFGVLAYETLTGKPPFSATSPLDLILAHLTQTPEAPSKVAPRGWVTRELDSVVLKALSKDPAERFASASEFVKALGDALKGRRTGDITRDEFEARKKAVLEAPTDDDKALSLESAGNQGIAWADVLAALADAASSTDSTAAKKALLFRASRVAQLEVKDLARARALYEQVVALDEGDEVAKSKLAEVRRAMATPEEKAELLLEEAEKEAMPSKRAEIYRELAAVYEKELSDKENALTAATEALTADPSSDEAARDVERLAGDDASRWNETLAGISEAVTGKDPAEAAKLMVRAGRWYSEKLSRPDFAVACFTKALAIEAGNDAALEGAAEIYRKAQQWPELVAVLLKRADAQAAPARARELRAEGADLLQSKLGDATRARDLLEKVLAEDPAQPRAAQVLERIYIAQDDWAGLVSLLERKAEALTGTAKADALCEIAETYEDRLKDDAKAAANYERARSIDDRNIPALKGLERLYARTGDTEKLLRALESQVQVAATPRQKVELHTRIAAIYEEEFVDHAKAAANYEAAAAIDPANDGALTGLSRLYRVTQRWDDLIALLDRHATLVDSDKRKVDLHVARGRVLLDPVGSIDRAGAAFDKALELDPNNPAALEGAAKVRAMRGDIRAAAEALDALAAQAKTPSEKAEAYFRAAKILEEKGDRDGAIDRYKRAIDADEAHSGATVRLRELYAARGDGQGAIEMLMREIENADGVLVRARLWSDVARIYRDKLDDRTKALEAAEKAWLLDNTNEEAAALLGEMRFERGDFAEAVKLLAPRASHAKDLPKDEGLRVTLRYGEALAKNGDEEKALEAFRTAREIAPADRSALAKVANSALGIGRFEQARELYRELLKKFGGEMDKAERAAALLASGTAALKLKDSADAVKTLAEAAELDEHSTRGLDAYAEALALAGNWAEAAKTRQKRLDRSPDAEKFDQAVELGELYASKAQDKPAAARAFMVALELRPDDRRILTRLMQLYSEGGEWGRLVDVIVKLAELVDDKAQRAKYYFTAAQVCHEQQGRHEQATDYYELALEHDPASARAIEGLTAAQVARKDYAGLEQSYKKVLSRLGSDANKSAVARLEALRGDLYATHLANVSAAIEAYERAQELDPSQFDQGEKLAELYLRDGKKNFDKAVRAQRALLAKNAQRTESFKALRKLFTENKRPDEAWCLCQALTSLKAAEPEEENFFKRFRTDTAAATVEKISDELWSRDLLHREQDPLLTSIFATITPAVLSARAEKREAYGLGDKNVVPESDEGQMARTLVYAAGALGLKTPAIYAKREDQSGLSILSTNPPALLLGSVALAGGPAQPLAFIAGSKLAYFRSGHFIRQLVPTGTGLRAWLFAAIRAVNPAFPVTPELVGSVTENTKALEQYLSGANREFLTSLVSKLLNSAHTLDLKRWTIGVDLTADRAGFVLANDLPRSLAVIRATPDDVAPLPAKDRIRELISYAISDEYFHLRQRLGISIAS